MLSWLHRLLNRQCPGVGDVVASPIIREIDPWAEVAEYVGHCGGCGKQRPCNGEGIMLPHKG